jgi:hypothetical protein
MAKKTLVLIHRVDYDYEVVVGCFTCRRELYLGWKKYLEEYARIEKREVTNRLKLTLGKEVRDSNDIDRIKKDRDILQKIEEGSFLCYDKAKTLFYVNLVPKNSIRFDREPFELDSLFPNNPICPWCLSLEYQGSTCSFSMEHIKPTEESESDPACEKDQPSSKIKFENIQKWAKWAFDWTLWLLGFPVRT